jgi:putative transposase
MRRRFCMKKSKYSDSRILSILKQAEAGQAVPELCRENGLSSATFYKWRAKYGGMDGFHDVSSQRARS